MTEEDKYHLYAINKSLLSEKEITEIENKIHSDVSFSEYIENLRLIHQEINTFDSSDLDIGKITSEILNMNTIRNIFELKPAFPDDDYTDKLNLAAMQKNAVNDSFVYYNTYASAEKFILIRVLKKSQYNEYKFFLICDEMNLVGYSVVKFSNTDTEFIADEKGTLTLKSDYMNKDTDLKVYIPDDVFIIDLNDLKDSYNSEKTNSDSVIRAYKKDGFLVTEFETGYLKDKTLYAVFDNDFNGFIKPEKFIGNSYRIEIKNSNINEIKMIIINE